MKHMSLSVQVSTTFLKPALSTESSSPVSDSSMRSKSVGKASQRLKQRRQPWQMSKTRRSSASICPASVKSGSCQSMGCRTGAPSPPSRMTLS